VYRTHIRPTYSHQEKRTLIFICITQKCIIFWTNLRVSPRRCVKKRGHNGLNKQCSVCTRIWSRTTCQGIRGAAHNTRLNKSCRVCVCCSVLQCVAVCCSMLQVYQFGFAALLSTHVWMSHLTHTNVSCHTTRMNAHNTRINKSCRAYKCVLSCYKYEWVTAHIWWSHAMSLMWQRQVMSHIWTGHVTHVTESEPWASTGRRRPMDSLSLHCRSFSAKQPLIIGRFCGKWPLFLYINT